jgi:hypothetical protein
MKMIFNYKSFPVIFDPDVTAVEHEVEGRFATLVASRSSTSTRFGAGVRGLTLDFLPRSH